MRIINALVLIGTIPPASACREEPVPAELLVRAGMAKVVASEKTPG
jgi:hypothetical protein